MFYILIMDLQLVPDIDIPKEVKEKWRKRMNEIVTETEREYQEWHDKKVKAGYSEDEIMQMLC